MDFLRQWELHWNPNFDDQTGSALIHEAHTTSLTITPTLWRQKTCAIGLRVKQGKGGGVWAYQEIAMGFHLWLDLAVRLAVFN